MNTRLAYNILMAGAITFVCSCKNTPSKNHGPIVLGDSSTIVTETDPEKLQDLVTELHPNIPSPTATADSLAAVRDTTKIVHADTAVKKPAAAQVVTAPQPETPTNGLKADFAETSVLIGNVTAKIAGNGNLQHANGAVYTLQSGTVNGNVMKVTGNVTKVSQRYQSIVIIKDGNTIIPVESLSNTTAWEAMKGGNNMYRITGLDAASMEYADDGPAAIRNAVIKAAQRHHMSKKKIQDLQNSLRNVKAANQKPLIIALRSVMWKIDGKDAKGHIFSKQIRIDIPM